MVPFAQRTNRLFLEDIYTADILSAAYENMPNLQMYPNIRVFTTGGVKQYNALTTKYNSYKIEKSAMRNMPFVMCVRPSMINYLRKLNQMISFENGVLFYAMWKGYLENDDIKTFIEFMKNAGVSLHILHTSGHADAKTIHTLIESVKPSVIIPVHTENSQWFNRYAHACKIVYDSTCIF